VSVIRLVSLTGVVFMGRKAH